MGKRGLHRAQPVRQSRARGDEGVRLLRKGSGTRIALAVSIVALFTAPLSGCVAPRTSSEDAKPLVGAVSKERTSSTSGDVVSSSGGSLFVVSSTSSTVGGVSTSSTGVGSVTSSTVGSVTSTTKGASTSSTTGVSVTSTTKVGVTSTTKGASTSSTTGVSVTSTSPSTTVSVAGGVSVSAGDSLQKVVDAHPAGTTFVLGAGVYRRQSVKPKDGDVFVGESGAVLTGEDVTEYAFSGAGDGVVIRGLVVEHYNNPLQSGAISAANGGRDWVVEDSEIRYNHGIGLKAGSGWKVLDNYVHHNGQLGLGGSGSNILVQGNEIAFNNYKKEVRPSWGGGGAKWVLTRNLVVRGNYSHDNYGPGLWTDIDNENVLYEGNRVENNFHAGIKHEISYSAVIRNNTLKGNGFGISNDVKGGGILIANSPNVEVYGNTVVGNNQGIGAVQHDRYDEPAEWKAQGEFELKNLYVHDNYVQTSGQTGIFVASGPYGDKPLTSWNNRFDHNTYVVAGNSVPFRWGNDKIGIDEWQSHGQDTHSTFQ
jgi:parallel beta-helix repeat protein